MECIMMICLRWFILVYFYFLSLTGYAWSLHLEQVPLRYLLQTLADIQGQNIVLSQNIQGKMDVHLNRVSWEQIWDFMVQTQHLSIQDSGGIVWVDRTYHFLQKGSGVKNMMPTLQHKWVKLIHVEAKDIVQILSDKNQSCLSPVGKILSDEHVNGLWISDVPEHLEQAMQVIQQIDVPRQQVEIQARIVSMNKNAAKDLGVRLGFTQPGLMSGQLAGLQSENTNDRLNVNLAALPLEATPISYAVALAKFGQQYIDAELSMLEGKGRAKIISRPRLMTQNQKEASISSGEDIPYQESSLNGATSVAFKKALLQLKVKPSILANGKLLLDLEIHQDADSGRRVQGVPIISTKAMSTKVFIRSGETLVLGGINKKDVHYEKVGLPILKDLPGLSQLFSREQERHLDEELILFITPKIQ
ncbi:MAG: type IV pilus secretin PilQ [Gammaproteobacteria bacterium]|nr:type IV pilus secretin PilQ [Gammaproteobacteria bacterium]